MTAVEKKDVIIVGAGPTGLAAAIYGGRFRYQTLVLEKLAPGGQINLTDRVENYPGIIRVSGPDLVDIMRQQALTFGAEIKSNAEVCNIERQEDGLLRVVTDEVTYLARVVILAPGSEYRRLGVPGEEKFRQAGAGVSYCGTCDAPFFRDKVVVAVGGGNVAIEDTIHLSRYCRKVILAHRRKEFRGDKILVEELLHEATKGIIEIRYDTLLTAIEGADRVESVYFKNILTGQSYQEKCDGVFVFVGMVPNTGFLKGVIDLDESGFIRCDTTYLRTSMPGVFVAGDCREGAAMQLATAVGDGVAATIYMKEYLRDPKWWFHARRQDIVERTW